MRVVCDNCGATYKIPESKLTKEVNKATCRKCGHRMLIRRAVAAPPPALAPTSGDGEHTQIRRPPPAPVNEWADDGPTRIARAPEDDHERPTVAMEEPPPIAPAPAPAPPTLPRPVAAHPAPVVPAPAPMPAPIPAPAPAPAPVAAIAPAAPAPAPVAPVAVAPAAPPAFNPSGDLSWAALGSAVAVAGALVLAFNITANPTLRTVGLALALSGSLLSVFVLLTGGRGLKKANVVVSVVFAALLGVGTAAVIHGVFTSLYGMNESIEMAASRGAPPAPVEADPADDDVLAALADPGGLAEVEEVDPEADTDVDTDDEEPVAVVAAAAPAPRRAEPRAEPIRGSGRDVAPARPAPAPAPARVAPAAAPEPPPEPAPKPALNRLPTSVVETMIRNNKRIKRCWMEEKQRSGELPKRVDVKFTVQPSGAVSSARSATRKYRGTDFEVCLGSAFRSITFPPFDGEPLSMTYNFAL